MAVTNIFPNAAQADTLNETMAGVLLNVERIADSMDADVNIKDWATLQTRVRFGTIGHYLAAGDQLTVEHASILTATVDGTGITACSVTNKDLFLEQAGTQVSDYEFTYDTAWRYDGAVVTLADYGLSVTGTAVSGDSIVVHRTATTYDFDVEGIDEMQTAYEHLEHNLSILMHGVYSQINFDPAQYLFAVTAESLTALGISGSVLPAGTYNVTLLHGAYNGGTNEDGTYKFTTTQAVPIGGGIRHSYMGTYQANAADYAKAKVLAGTFETYGANTYTTIETGLTTTEGSTGTSLGTATACDPQYKAGDYINYTQRQRYGSNRWSTSWLRQLLNSEDAVLAWTPKTIWSRNLNVTPEGYLHTIDPELRAVLAKTRTRYAKSISDGYGYEDIEDYVTLETMLDVYGSNNNSIAEGPVTADGTVKRTTYTSLWKDAAQEDKIKYQGSTARYWWLASTYPSNGYGERSVNSSGALDGNLANHSFGVVPRLTIA